MKKATVFVIILAICGLFCACTSIESKLESEYTIDDVSTSDLQDFADILDLEVYDYNIESAFLATHSGKGFGVMVIACQSAADASKLYEDAEEFVDLLERAYADHYKFTRKTAGNRVFLGEDSAVGDAIRADIKTSLTNSLFWTVFLPLFAFACGYASLRISAYKGYDGGFIWGFCLGIIGIIIVYRKTPLNSPAQTVKKKEIPEETKATATPLPGKWVCSCGRTNAPMVSTCYCGLSKHMVIAQISTDKKKQDGGKTSEQSNAPKMIISPESKTEPIENENTSQGSETNTITYLKAYKDLLDSGVISQEEYDAKKKQLLGL